MAARKPHRKSRAGCMTCKKRHVKCGEERPNCHNCLEYDLDCRFLQTAAVSLKEPLKESLSSDSSSSANDLSRIPVPAAGIGANLNPGSDDLEVSDLELIHFFSTVTYATMSNVPEEQKLWQSTIVTLGLQHKFLLRGLLAHAAIHLSSLKSSPESISYMIKASTHQDIALAQFRKSLETITASTFDPVLAFSCLLPIHSIALAACATARPINEHEQDSLSEFLKAIRLFRSVNMLLLPSLSVLTTSTILPLLQITTQHLPEADTYPGISSLHLLEASFCSPRTSALNYSSNGTLPHPAPGRNEILSETFRELRLAFARTAHPSSTSRFTLGIVLIWTIVIPEGFMMLVDQQDPGAMVLLAHFAALLCWYEGIWWLRGLGSSMVRIIVSMLGEEWNDVMEWPKGVAERVVREREMVG
ncbi:hypothetical protein G7Y89_g6632 [Cudoniella acicularis]|uniref:Zn(2)-C6 fungal-type domain-containing protein n=1 Tax=Cudoniella acicularis TaxID=354080 RepID=A0A8H4RK31_9HELO|nr:hypothetical protein G7Y89_g6632 [Cudoniella acicularis]